MPENTWIYDTVWEEYREEHGHTIDEMNEFIWQGDRSVIKDCLLYTSPSPRDKRQSRMPSSA